MAIRYGRLDAPPEGTHGGDGASDAVVWLAMPHARYDGLGALDALLAEVGAAPDGGLPQATGLTPLGGSAQLAAFARVMRAPSSAATFRGHDLAWQPTPGDSSRALPAAGSIAWRCFSREATLRLQAAARAAGVTLNSLLLWGLHRAVAPEVDGGDDVWLIPVNLRGLVCQRRAQANHIAFLHVPLPRGSSVEAVHAAVWGGLARGDHWGAWALSNTGELIGARGVELIARWGDPRRRVCLGAFSNLGALRGTPDGRQWLFAPPVSFAQPLGAGALGWNGRLSLLVQLHPSVPRRREEVAALLDRWVDAVGAAR
jgi:hypothetical protein